MAGFMLTFPLVNPLLPPLICVSLPPLNYHLPDRFDSRRCIMIHCKILLEI